MPPAVEHMRHLVETHAALASKRAKILDLLGQTYGVELMLPARADAEVAA